MNLKKLFDNRSRSIRVTIAVSFSLVASISMILLGTILYRQLSLQESINTTEREEQFLNQTRRSLEDYLHNMRRTSDALYYIGIKNKDMTVDDITDEMNLLYEADKDNLVNIALYSSEGELIGATPVSTQKADIDVTSQDWFSNAVAGLENLHFSVPHVQNLFEEAIGQYHWVISVSRMVELNRAGYPQQGVLLVDMNFDAVSQLLNKANADNMSGYIYLCDERGDIIYHPRQKLINTGLLTEDNLHMSARPDGDYREKFNGEERITIVKTVSYTGWKLISVIPMSAFSMSLDKMQYLVVLMLSLAILGIVLINQLVTARITQPIVNLEDAVRDMESGNLFPVISQEGPREVSHLAKTLSKSVVTIRQLMDDLVTEQEEKRKSELDALQSQINPHFLYNALDSVVWLIEGERYQDAVYTVKELANLMRVSISHGRNVIPVSDEIRHAKSYMNIQNIRYRNTFDVEFDVDDDIMSACTVKLIVQPLLENAIYYGVKGMEDDAQIRIRGYRRDGDVYIDVTDNGIGMPKEQVEVLLDPELSEEYRSSHESLGMRHGNGVGLINVDMRIRLLFGEKYGLIINSEPDEGTTMSIHIPYIRYSDDIEQGMKNR